MCRNIRTLFNFEPPATQDEIRASALQFVRKLSGFTHPSKTNEVAFYRAVDEVQEAARRLLDSLESAAGAIERLRSDVGQPHPVPGQGAHHRDLRAHRPGAHHEDTIDPVRPGRLLH